MNRSKGCAPASTVGSETPVAQMTISDALVKIAERIEATPWRRVAAEFLAGVLSDERKWATFEKSFKRLADAAWCERRASLHYPKTRRGKMILEPPAERRKSRRKPLKSGGSGKRTRSSAGVRQSRSTSTKTKAKQRLAPNATGRGRAAGIIDADRENEIVRRIVEAAMKRVSSLVEERFGTSTAYEKRSCSMQDEGPRARARAFPNLVDSESLTNHRGYGESSRDIESLTEGRGDSSRDSESLTVRQYEGEGEKANRELFANLPTVRAERATKRLAGELVEEAVAIWNKLAEYRGLRRVVKLTPERRKKLVRVLEEVCECNIETWKEACRKVARSAFLCGRNDRGWQANFDFMTRPTALVRVLEGVYDTRKTFTDGHDGENLAAGALALLARRAAVGVDGALVRRPSGAGGAAAA